MKFKNGDRCLKDYERRRAVLLKQMVDENWPLERRSKKFNDWVKANSPYTASERLANFMAALQLDHQ